MHVYICFLYACIYLFSLWMFIFVFFTHVYIFVNNKINKLHERALRLVYKGDKLSFQQLLNMDNSVSIHHRNLQKLAIEIFKVKNNLSPSFMNTVFPLSQNPYNLRIILLLKQKIFEQSTMALRQFLTEVHKHGH